MVTLNAYIYKPLLTAIARANDHKGLAGPMSRNRQSCENLKISFENFLGKMTNIFWEPQFWLKIFKKIPSIAAKLYFSSKAHCKFKTSVAASRNIA